MKDFISHRYIEKFRAANTTLGLMKTMNQEVNTNDISGSHQEITRILARSFKRGILLKISEDSFLCSYKNIDVNFFHSEVETESCNFAYRNGCNSGRDTNTLRNSKAIFLPIHFQNKTIGVVEFSCIEDKFSVTEKLIFYQIEASLAFIITLLESQKISKK